MKGKIEGGYALQPRKLFKSDIWQNKPPLWRALWSYLWGTANYADGEKLKRGQLFTSLPILQEVMSYKVGYRTHTPTRSQLWCALEAYREDDMITTTKTTRGIIVTICNYDFYQNPANYEANGDGDTNATTKTTTTCNDTKEREERKKTEADSLELFEDISEAAFISIPLKDKSEFALPWKTVREWEQTYKAIDVQQEVREYRQWAIANPSQQKKRSGILRSINLWLQKDNKQALERKAASQPQRKKVGQTIHDV